MSKILTVARADRLARIAKDDLLAYFCEVARDVESGGNSVEPKLENHC